MRQGQGRKGVRNLFSEKVPDTFSSPYLVGTSKADGKIKAQIWYDVIMDAKSKSDAENKVPVTKASP